MKTKQTFLVLGVIAGICLIIFYMIPDGAGIRGQIIQVGMIMSFLLAVVAWIIEAVVLIVGPWILGAVVGTLVFPLLDEIFQPDEKMSGFTDFILNVAVSILFFFLWLLVPIIMTNLPPISNFLIGPWIYSHMESGLYWWGLYAAGAQFFIHYGVKS